jgi:hypothetical protein
LRSPLTSTVQDPLSATVRDVFVPAARNIDGRYCSDILEDRIDLTRSQPQLSDRVPSNLGQDILADHIASTHAISTGSAFP